MELAAYLERKEILLWGMGREGLSSYRFLRRHFPEKPLAVADKRLDTLRAASELGADRHLRFLKEEEGLSQLDSFDLVLKAPGISLLGTDLGGHAGKITGQADLFLQFAPGKTIGVTGTKGKSTTSSLLCHLLRPVWGDRLFFGGNIGVPLWDFLDALDDHSCTVAELSSYQLETVKHPPSIALWLNLYEEHLNYHGGFAAYAKAKANLAAYLKPDGHLIYRGDDPRLVDALPASGEGQRHPFDARTPFPFRQPPGLPGLHNRLNAVAAIAAAQLLGVKEATIQASLDSFESLPHRLEPLGEFGGVGYYNDSISTVPEATLAALQALPGTRTLIVGGMDRGIAYDGLAEALFRSAVRLVILLPETGRRIAALWEGKTVPFTVRQAENLEEAVALAKAETEPGGICLFSPAASSYHRYKNFEERGKAFRTAVRKS